MAAPRRVGLTLRLAGPLVQIVGIALFLGDPDGSRRVGWLPARAVGLGLIGAGLVLVIAGLVLSGARSRRRRERPAYDLDFDRPAPKEAER